MQEILKRYGLLALAPLAVVFYAIFPQYVIQLRYFHICCIILTAFNGKSYIEVQDVKGWALQKAALLLHAACLIVENMLANAA